MLSGQCTPVTSTTNVKTRWQSLVPFWLRYVTTDSSLIELLRAQMNDRLLFFQGIIDAGGRNVTVSLQSRTGHTNMMAVVGMLVFTQYWYWFPLSHFLSLAFTPSCVIGLNENLDMPVIQMRSNAKPSTYAYPAPLEEKKKEDKEKVALPYFAR